MRAKRLPFCPDLALLLQAGQRVLRLLSIPEVLQTLVGALLVHKEMAVYHALLQHNDTSLHNYTLHYIADILV